MESKKSNSLREKAEEKFRTKQPNESISLSEADKIKLLFELEVHQIELEMQNEDLQLAMKKTETAVSLYDFAPTGYLTLDENSTIIELNFSAAKMLAKKRSNLIDRRFGLFITLATRGTYNDFFESLLATDVKQTCEVQFLIKGDSNIFVTLEGIALKEESKYLITALDVTEKIYIEKQLTLTKERLEAFFDITPSLMMITNPEGVVIKINKSCNNILGYTIKEIINIDLWSLLHPDDIERTKKAKIKEARMGSEILNFTNRYKHKNGSYKTLEWQATIVKDGFRYAIANDVTERNEIAKKLRKVKENQYQMLFDSMTEMVQVIELIYDKQGQPIDFYIREINLSFINFLGKAKNQLINKKASSIIDALEEYWLTSFASVEKTGKAISFESYRVKLNKYYYVNAWEISENRLGVSITDITAKKLIEEEKLKAKLKIETSQKRLNEAQKLAKVGSWLFTPSTQEVEWSNETFCIYGFDPKKGVPDFDTMINLIHSDDKEFVLEAIGRGMAFNIEHRISLLNGEQKWISVICKPIFGKKDELVSLAGTNQDITKRKLLEEEKLRHQLRLEKISTKLNEAQEIAKVGSWLFSAATKKIEWSDGMFHLWGFDSKKGVPELDLVAKRVHADDLELFKSAVTAASSTGIPFDIEYRINFPNGEQKIIRSICKPVLGDTGKVVSSTGFNQDITAQKLVEEEKLRSKLKIENISNELNQAQKLAKVGSWFFNLSSKEAQWSDETFNAWGLDYKKGAPDYDSLVKQVHTDDLELFTNSYNKALAKGIPFDIEYRINFPNGEKKIIRSICQPILGENGKVISLTGANQDITVQKQFEEAQGKHQRLKAIGEMSSSIAHDFNNSLQQMMGNLEVIKFQKELSGSTLERLNNLENTINDVAGRVSALQKFGDTDHENKNLELIDFNTLIEEVLNQSRPLWKDDMEKEGLKINIITDFAAIPKISCSSGELKSAIYNLIKNSIEAMPKGGDLIIKTGAKAEGVFATFTDTGIGMDEKVRAKVFEPFFTTKGFQLGRGLGMSGVFSTIKKYNGTIVVKSSKLDKGTTFEIVFPIGKQDKIEVRSENEQKDQKAFSVLWVDDDAIITENVSELLELMGHKCAIANSGKNALEYLNNNTCDVVFTDIGMPEMNGWELIAAIRNNFGNKIKIVTVTGWAIDEDVKEKHAIDFVIQKPFTLKTLEKLFLTL